MRPLLPKLFAVVLLAALGAAALYFPINKIALAIALIAYGALLWRRPDAWLLVVPALLPVLDLAPLTGWFYLDELDLVLLATAACGYARIGRDGRPAALPAFFRWSLTLFAVSFAISAVIGLLPLSPLDANAFSNYSSHFNSLRVAKGLAWALVLLPLLRRAAGPDLSQLARYFIPGMLLGLAGACLAVGWERLLFPGLLNFASDYRPTATFSAMHTGGAALDAYLAISFPFVAAWLLGATSRWKLALALLLLLLGCYAGLTIFSRDIYLAYGVSGAIVLALLLTRRARQGRLRAATALGATALLAVAAVALVQVFASGGYRSLACALVLLTAAVIVAGAAARLNKLALCAGCALGLAAMVVVLALSLDKGVYIGFMLCAATFACGSLLLLSPDGGRAAQGLALAAGAFPALALGSCLVASHWGGPRALLDAAILAALAGAALVANRRMARPFLRLNRGSVTLTFFCAIVLATVIPVSSSYYLGARFATVGDDLGVRMRHWSEALDIMDPGTGTSLFGMGLGRYPEAYAWKNTHNELPAVYRYENEAGNLFLRLGAPQYAIGYGEVLRLLQHADVKAGGTYRLGVDVRHARAGAAISIALCERWMLYPQNCAEAPLQLSGASGAWHRYEVEIRAGALGAGLLAPPVQLEVSIAGAGTVDVDNLSLREAGGGAELLRNRDFSDANDYWFFSSDRNHFPWHVKNFAVNTFFEQGWLGLATMAVLLLYLCAELATRALQGEATAGIYLAALAGFLTVGAFDSLFDVPRLTLLFFLVLSAAVMRPAKVPAAHGGSGRRRVRRESAEAGSPSSQDQLPAAPPKQAEKSSNAP
jgi:hypothetical protein